MSNATRPLFSGDTDEASRIATELALAVPASPNDTNDAALREAISILRTSSALPYRERLAARLDVLREAFSEDGDGEIFAADSLRAVLMFLDGVPSLPYPSITLTSGGEVCATWQSGKKYFFGSRFFDAERVDFAAHFPNE
jgi:hypothetical protein